MIASLVFYKIAVKPRNVYCTSASILMLPYAGRCYPCVFMTTISCNCGKTRVQVPCEQRQQTRLPKCRELCSTPPTCHHPSRTPHLCHRKECPPCQQECGKGSTCGHYCPVACHSEPKHRPQEVRYTCVIKLINYIKAPPTGSEI